MTYYDYGKTCGQATAPLEKFGGAEHSRQRSTDNARHAIGFGPLNSSPPHSHNACHVLKKELRKNRMPELSPPFHDPRVFHIVDQISPRTSQPSRHFLVETKNEAKSNILKLINSSMVRGSLVFSKQ